MWTEIARAFADQRAQYHTVLQCRTVDALIDRMIDAIADSTGPDYRFSPERFRTLARYGQGSHPPQGRTPS